MKNDALFLKSLCGIVLFLTQHQFHRSKVMKSSGLWIIFWMMFLGIACDINSPTGISPDKGDFEDFYYSQVKKIPLTISTEKISIKFKRDVTQAKIQRLLSSEPILEELKPLDGATPGFFTIQLKAPTDVKQLVQRLKNRPEVDLVNPVYLIEGSLEAIPFDIFIVQFKPSVTRDQIDELNKPHHVEVVLMSPASWNLYTFRITTASDLSVLKMSQLFYESLPAEWSLPDFISPIDLHPALNRAR